MRSRRPSQEHADAVARRLAELSAQLASARAIDDTAERPLPLELERAAGDEWWSDHTRVAQRPPLSVVPPVTDEPPGQPGPAAPDPRQDDVGPGGEPGWLPVPGRHAARRPLARAPDLLPASLRGRVRLGSRQLTAVAVLVAVGMALTAWWVVRGDPEPPEQVTMETATEAGPGEPILPPTGAGEAEPSAPMSGADSAPVTVDVAGKVRRPGIVVLDAGARVVDALEQAGGARPGVDLTSINLARVLIDGEQIVVGIPGGAASPPLSVPPAGAGQGDPTALVDLNLADQTLLETLPQVGPVTATAIIAWRTEHGAFTAVTELLEVDGIGDATLNQLLPYVTV